MLQSSFRVSRQIASAARGVLRAAFVFIAIIDCARIAAAQPADSVERGAYLFRAGGCAGCHTDTKNKGPFLAGGRELKTPFGTFYGPNITPDPTHGIGRWSEADFIRAMRDGIRPDGAHYFPVFPFTSFTLITEADLKLIWSYLRTVPPQATPNRPHEVGFPFNLRFLQVGWKWLNFEPGAFRPDASKSAQLNRGAYLVHALGHCAECHTPRNLIGGLERKMWLAGTADGPEGARVPNITPALKSGLGEYSPGDLLDVLKTGLKPDGDVVGSGMFEVVDQGLGKLSDDDLQSIVAYLKALPPIESDWKRKK